MNMFIHEFVKSWKENNIAELEDTVLRHLYIHVLLHIHDEVQQHEHSLT